MPLPRRKKPPPPKQPKFKSKFEQLVYNSLINRKVEARYEPDKLEYTIPAKVHKYTPDFKIGDKVYIESKGFFKYTDREKMLLIKEAYPDYKFYLCFQNAFVKLYKGSKTTYGDWATKNGFEWCHMPKGIPNEWTDTENDK